MKKITVNDWEMYWIIFCVNIKQICMCQKCAKKLTIEIAQAKKKTGNVNFRNFMK